MAQALRYATPLQLSARAVAHASALELHRPRRHI